MNNHAHKHDHCQHEHVKYCRQCDKPHCLDCGFEWNRTQYCWPYNTNIWPTSQPIYSYVTSGGATTLGNVTASNNVFRDNVSSTVTTTLDCKHEN